MVETPTAQASPRKASGAWGGDFVVVVIPEAASLSYQYCGVSGGLRREGAFETELRLNFAQSQLRDRRQLHEGSSFVDLSDLGVAVQLLDGVVLDEAGPAEHFDGEAGHALV